MSQNIKSYPVMNPVFTVNEVESTNNLARLVIEPLEQGYGHTVGNALRRVLLTSLPGCAISMVSIKGVDHQYSTLDGMSEDVVELILNLKQVRVKATGNDKGVLRLNVKGAKKVTAADIECEAGFEIVNKDQAIATLAEGKKLEVEMTVESGLGYTVAADVKTDVVGQIVIDALYSPVVKVSYKVEATRVGGKTDYDRIVLDVETDGTITPLEAVNQSAMILAKQFTQIFNPTVVEEKVESNQLSPEEAETLRLTVEELDLPTRIANALRKGGYQTVGDLIKTPRAVIAKVKNLGEKSVDLINDALVKKGVSLED
ncbi:MAG: DNA-directed RNA polymerase subunit alpha [Patescibacteria group bacterium]